MTMRLVPFHVYLLPLMSYVPVSAQTLLWTQTGQALAGVGPAVRIVDRNSDGVDDFMTMVAVRTPPYMQVEIQFRPVSGADGAFLPCSCPAAQSTSRLSASMTY